MESTSRLERAVHLLISEEYLFAATAPCGSQPAEEVVRFVGFTSCIATVVVLDRQGRQMLVDRTRLFKIRK